MDPPGGKYSSSAFDFTAIGCPLFVVVVIRGFNFCVVFLSLLLLLTDDDEAATTNKDVCDPVNALMFLLCFIMRARACDLRV